MFSLWAPEFSPGPLSPVMSVFSVSISVTVVAQKQMDVNFPPHLQDVDSWSESFRILQPPRTFLSSSHSV